MVRDAKGEVSLKKWVCLILAIIPIVLIPLMGLTWLIFSVFCFLIYFKPKLKKWYQKIHLSSGFKFILFFLLFGYITEISAVVDNLPKPPEQRALLNPNPLIDLYLAFGYYLAFALVWYLFTRRFNFTYRDAFLIAGSFGILFEQSGKILLSFNPFAWLYVFLVYGSFQASALVISENDIAIKKISPWKKVILGIALEVSAFLLAGAFLWLLQLPIK